MGKPVLLTLQGNADRDNALSSGFDILSAKYFSPSITHGNTNHSNR